MWNMRPDWEISGNPTINLLQEFGGTPIEGRDEITIVPPEP